MPPIKSDLHDFSFDATEIVRVRSQSGLTQKALAERLDIPVNTVSRWETGATTPDARALAAIYSVAQESEVTPQFFKRRTKSMDEHNRRTKLHFLWDFQNIALEADVVKEEWACIKKYLRMRFSSAASYMRFSAYTAPHQSLSGQVLEKLGIQVFEGSFDADSQIINDARTACEKGAEKTILVLASNDGNFSGLLTDLKKAGVEVYVMGRDNCSERLRKAVSEDGFIPWDAPYVIAECMEVVKTTKGKPINRSEFGNKCKERLEDTGIFPGDVGYSRRNPYGSVLRWLEREGIVKTSPAKDERDSIVIKRTR